MIINFGSINIDHVYRVPHMPAPGETLLATDNNKFLGGKGVNQSIAVAKAGGEVLHVGAVGSDGEWALEQIQTHAVNTKNIAKLDCATGHAIIYVDEAGENQIVIASGANVRLSEAMIDAALDGANPEHDWILLQNETNLAEYIVARAHKQGFKIAYAAAPFVAETTLSLLDKITLLAVNEGEAAALAKALGVNADSIPVPELLVTLGAKGAKFKSEALNIRQNAYAVEAVDTTGAGDTFLGSFLAHYTNDRNAKAALSYASAASALQIMQEGAATAIPENNVVIKFMEQNEPA